MKIDVSAVRRMLAVRRGERRPGYDQGMGSFTLHGEIYDYVESDPGNPPEEAKSWTYGQYPKIRATLLLADGGSVTVYAVAERWNPTHILVSWADDGRHANWAWVPSKNVERVSDSEWDIEEYRRCPDKFRSIRWGDRLPGFLPA